MSNRQAGVYVKKIAVIIRGPGGYLAATSLRVELWRAEGSLSVFVSGLCLICNGSLKQRALVTKQVSQPGPRL